MGRVGTPVLARAVPFLYPQYTFRVAHGTAHLFCQAPREWTTQGKNETSSGNTATLWTAVMVAVVVVVFCGPLIFSADGKTKSALWPPCFGGHDVERYFLLLSVLFNAHFLIM